MTEKMNGHIPIPLLSGGQPVGKARVGTQLGALPRKLDQDGMLEVDVVRGPNGQPTPATRRSDFMDATELLQAIREVVRDELQKAQFSGKN